MEDWIIGALLGDGLGAMKAEGEPDRADSLGAKLGLLAEALMTLIGTF